MPRAHRDDLGLAADRVDGDKSIGERQPFQKQRDGGDLVLDLPLTASCPRTKR